MISVGMFKIMADGQMHHVLRALEKGGSVGWVRVNSHYGYRPPPLLYPAEKSSTP